MCVKVLLPLTVTTAVSYCSVLLLTEICVLVITCVGPDEVPSLEEIPLVELADVIVGVESRLVSEEVVEDGVACDDTTDVEDEDASDDNDDDVTGGRSFDFEIEVEDDSEVLLENRVGVGESLEMTEVAVEVTAALADDPVPLGMFCRY